MEKPEQAAMRPDAESPPDDSHATDPPPQSPSRPPSYWVRKFLICNPFYLVSAALLLYGLYLVSTDDHFPGREMAQLVFNFSALQFYEILVVVTAILLARRQIWYDSNLLIFLENGLVLVPFILLSQAALISQGVVRAMCVAAAITAGVRFGALKRKHRELNLPGRLLGIGAVLLLVNVALLLVYRTLNETKVGTKPTEGAAYVLNECAWLLILPAMIALANALPRATATGELLPHRRWVPGGLFSLWVAAAAVHVRSLSYVYNFDWEPYFIVPPLWVLAWTICNRFAHALPLRGVGPASLIAPAAITLLAAILSAPGTFLVLTTINIAVYVALGAKQGFSRTLRHLIVLSLIAGILGVASLRRVPLPFGLDVGECVWLCGLIYVCFWIFCSRDPRLGILGAALVWIAANGTPLPDSIKVDLALHSAILFLLLHSLVWRDPAHPGSQFLRMLACGVWLLHSLLVLVYAPPHGSLLLAAGALVVLAGCTVSRMVRGGWPPNSLTAMAIIVLLISPGKRLSEPGQSVPLGLWVMAGSFLLFVAGTILALTRSRWHPAVAANEKSNCPEVRPQSL